MSHYLQGKETFVAARWCLGQMGRVLAAGSAQKRQELQRENRAVVKFLVSEMRLRARHENKRALFGQSAFEWAALVTPRRIRVEDVGDAQEQLERLIVQGASRTRITVYVVAQLFYIAVNTAGYIVKKLSPFFGGKSSEG